MIKKKFLTEKDDGGGSILWETTTDFNKDSRFPIAVQSKLKITDCYRAIELEFWAGNREQYNDKLEKIDNLISALEEFRDHYSKAWTRPTVRYC